MVVLTTFWRDQVVTVLLFDREREARREGEERVDAGEATAYRLDRVG